MFCIQCGHKHNDENIAFCTSCGHPLPKETKLKQEEKIEAQKKEKPSKGKKTLLYVMISLLVIGIGAYFIIDYITDPMKKYAALEEAIQNDDEESFLEQIEFDESIPLDKTSYFEWLRDEEWDIAKSELLSIFNQQGVVEEPTRFTAFTLEDEPLFFIDVTPYLFGVFHTYDIKAVPTDLLVPEDALALKVTINGETFDLNEMEKGESLLEVYPGIYPFEGVSTDDDEKIYEEELLVEPYAKLFIPVTDGRVTYRFSTDDSYHSAFLYINGKKSDYTLKDLMQDGTLKARDIETLHAEWTGKDGEMTRSNTVYVEELDEDETISFMFDERNTSTLKTKDQKLRDVGSFVLSFRDAYEYAVNEGDYYYIENYLQDNSDVEEELIIFVGDMKRADYYYDFKSNTITDVSKKKESSYEVETNETFVFHDADGLIYDYDRIKRYDVEERDNTYEITKIDYIDTKKSVR